MKKLNMQENPALVIGGSLSAVVAAVIGLLRAFDVSVTPDQESAILTLVAVVGPFVSAVLIRRKVTPAPE